MRTIYIEIEEKSILNKKSHKTNHLWYDIKNKEMKTLFGGVLKFKYDSDKNEMIPYTEDAIISVYEKSNNEKEILSWIKLNSDVVFLNTEESRKNIVAINYDVNNEDLILSMLYSKRFRYS